MVWGLCVPSEPDLQPRLYLPGWLHGEHHCDQRGVRRKELYPLGVLRWYAAVFCVFLLHGPSTAVHLFFAQVSRRRTGYYQSGKPAEHWTVSCRGGV